jgi:ABC-type taurine transport system ATPase subunit
MDIAVETRALRRVYRSRSQEVVALDGIDLRVMRGQRYGVLGPNGAGKTTMIKILVTLLLPSSGEAYVDGLDVVHQFRELRHRIAMVSGGETVGFGMLKVKEQLWMFSQFYGMPSGAARRRIDELLERLRLTEAANRLVSALSSGMRQKMRGSGGADGPDPQLCPRRRISRSPCRRPPPTSRQSPLLPGPRIHRGRRAPPSGVPRGHLGRDAAAALGGRLFGL